MTRQETAETSGTQQSEACFDQQLGNHEESLEHNCPQGCHAVLIGLVGVCSGPAQGLHDIPLIPKRRDEEVRSNYMSVHPRTLQRPVKQKPAAHPIRK